MTTVSTATVTTTTTTTGTTAISTTSTTTSTTTTTEDPEQSTFMIIGGHPQSNNVEELKMNSNHENGCPVPNSFPVTIYGAVGVNMNGTPIVCGGVQGTRSTSGVQVSNQCWTYNLTSQVWTNSGQLRTTRSYAAAIYDPRHGLVITGGRSASGTYLSSAERTDDGINFIPFPDTPSVLFHHCLVSLKNGNLFATHSTGTFMYHGSNNSWSSLNNGNIENRVRGMVCGTIEEDGQVTDVVAAGVGSQGNTVSIYNIESGAWRTGENLPTQIWYGASVPYQGSFLILGGYCNSCSDNDLDTVIRYTMNGEWETLPMRLSLGRYYHTAIPKPAC